MVDFIATAHTDNITTIHNKTPAKNTYTHTLSASQLKLSAALYALLDFGAIDERNARALFRIWDNAIDLSKTFANTTETGATAYTVGLQNNSGQTHYISAVGFRGGDVKMTGNPERAKQYSSPQAAIMEAQYAKKFLFPAYKTASCKVTAITKPEAAPRSNSQPISPSPAHT